MEHRSGRRRTASAILSSALLCATLQVLAAAPPAAAATTIHVPAEYATITAAIAAADSGDTIHVAAGTYAESVDFAGKDVDVIGIAGSGSTIIDAAGANTSAVRIGPAGSLIGFTVRNGDADIGGGARVFGDGSVLRSNRFVGNSHDTGSGGAAVAIDSGSPIVERNTFTGNSCHGDTGELSGVVVANVWSGATPMAPVIRNNVFTENSCHVNLRLVDGAALVVNNTLAVGGLGIFLGWRIDDYVVRNNIVTQHATGVEFDSDVSDMGFDHNLISSNTKGYAGVLNPNGSNGNFASPPQLIDVEGGDLRLAATSPAVDAGSPTLAPSDDFDGSVRPLDGPDADGDAEVDIGAFEHDGSEPPPVPQTGTLDTRWSDDGKWVLQTRYRPALGGLGGGRLAVGVYKESDDGRMRLWGFDEDGDRDTAWGPTGYALRTFSPSRGISFADQIVPHGTRRIVVGSYNGTTARLGVAQLNSSGNYHLPFSGDGRATYKVFKYEHDLLEPFSAQVLTGGKIGIAVSAWDYNSRGELVYVGQAAMRLNAVGSLDKTFSGDGILPLAKDVGDVKFLPDGSVYMDKPAGNSREVRKFRPSGSYDTSFSGDGRALAPCGTHIGANIQADSAGRPLLMCVRTNGGTLDLRLVRFTTSGLLDPTFSGNGMAPMVLSGGTDDNWNTFMDSQGRAWAASPQASDRTKLIVQSLDASGEPNAAFSGDGRAILSLFVERELGGMTVSGDLLFIAGFREPWWIDVLAVAI